MVINILAWSSSISVPFSLGDKKISLVLVQPSDLHAWVVHREEPRVGAGDFFLKVVVKEEVFSLAKNHFSPDMSVDRVERFDPHLELRVRDKLYPGPHALSS